MTTPAWMNETTGLLVLAVLIALAHLGQWLAPRTSWVYWVSGKVLALGMNFYELVGKHPNPPAPFANAPPAPMAVPLPPSKGLGELRLLFSLFSVFAVVLALMVMLFQSACATVPAEVCGTVTVTQLGLAPQTVCLQTSDGGYTGTLDGTPILALPSIRGGRSMRMAPCGAVRP
jgi:hypothetical protein